MQKKLFFIRMIQLLLTIGILTFILFGELTEDGLVLGDFSKYFPCALGISITLLSFYELRYSKLGARQVCIGIFLVTAIILCQEGFVLLNAAIWLFALVYFFLSLFSIIKTKNAKMLKNESVRVKEKKTLPFGYYCSKDLILFIMTIVICCIPLLIGVVLIINAFFDDVKIPSITIPCIIFSIVALIVASIFYVFLNKLSKIIMKFSKSADYESFVKETNIILNNNLHKESITYVKLIQVNYCFLVDKEKAYELFVSLDIPEERSVLKFYKTIEILYYINQDNIEKAKELVENFKITYGEKDKQGINLIEMLTLYGSQDEIIDIERKYSINSTKLINIINASNLMSYYDRRGNKQKAKYYAQFILDNTTQLNEIIDNAKKVLASENELNL